MPNASACSILDRALLDCGIEPGSFLIVALSGGPDSVALLDSAVRVAPVRGWSVRAVHVNHGLRGREARDDERFVDRLCRELGVPLIIARVDAKAAASARRRGIEEAARELRYAELRAAARAWDHAVILTGHTADDQAETVLMRLLRGTGLTGLSAIRASSGGVVRPFLSVRRETILACLQDRRIGFRLDSTNLDAAHARNRIRHRVLPPVVREVPAAVEALSRAARLLQTDADYLQQETATALEQLDYRAGNSTITLSARTWRALHPALQRTTLRTALAALSLGPAADERLIEIARSTILEASTRPRRADLGRRVNLSVNEEVVRLSLGAAPTTFDPATMSVPGVQRTPSGSLTAYAPVRRAAFDVERLIAVCGPYHALCDADAVGGTLTVRPRRPGDRYAPFGLEGTRKVQDLFVDCRVPADQRELIALVTAGPEIVWIPGFAFSRRFAITASTATVLHLEFRPNPAVYRGTIPQNS